MSGDVEPSSPLSPLMAVNRRPPQHHEALENVAQSVVKKLRHDLGLSAQDVEWVTKRAWRIAKKR